MRIGCRFRIALSGLFFFSPVLDLSWIRLRLGPETFPFFKSFLDHQLGTSSWQRHVLMTTKSLGLVSLVYYHRLSCVKNSKEDSKPIRANFICGINRIGEQMLIFFLMKIDCRLGIGCSPKDFMLKISITS